MNTPSDTTRSAPNPKVVALVVYVFSVIVYAIFAGDRLKRYSPNNHFSYQAHSFLQGRLDAVCNNAAPLRNGSCQPESRDDWAMYPPLDRREREELFDEGDPRLRAPSKGYSVFPMFPAVVYVLPVAIWGRDFANPKWDVVLAGIAPALLYLLLERLSREGKSIRTWKENLGFTALFAFGTVYFFTVVQGSVWFTAHLIVCPLVVGYLWFALDARSPLLAGFLLALAIHTRADLAWASPFFAIEALRVHRKIPDQTAHTTDGLAEGTSSATKTDSPSIVTKAKDFLSTLLIKDIVKSLVLFAIPVAIGVVITFLLNKLRFDDYREVGYRYLQIGWRGRINRWGLFNYHYLSRNLAVALTILPWITRTEPFIMISRHGLALWVTTPHYLGLMRMRAQKHHQYTWFLALSATAVALTLLLYQNSGWVQFGYRFSNDFAVFLIVLLALNTPKMGKVWWFFLAVAIVINGFGAATFQRTFQGSPQPNGQPRIIDFYNNDGSQQVLFQPD